MIILNPFTEKELESYLQRDIAQYAQENIKAGYWTESEAMEKSRSSHARLLPQGVATPNQHLFSIWDSERGEPVGNIWMFADYDSANPSGFIYDLFIEERFRKKGYATAAMLALEGKAKELGLTALYLHVFAHNLAARSLYDKLGYGVKSTNMAKPLAAGSGNKHCSQPEDSFNEPPSSMDNDSSRILQIPTERLILTPLEPGDAVELYTYRSDPEVCRYQSWAPTSLADAQRFIGSLQSVVFDSPGTWFQFGIRLRGTHALVGDIGVHFPPDEPRQAEIGFTLAPSHQGQGLGTEAVNGLLNHLFVSLRKHRVFASVDPDNLRSIKLLKRVGMRQEAHFRESLWFKGKWVDDVVFAILESEWKTR